MEVTLSSGNARNLSKCQILRRLDFVAIEEIVLFAAAAVRALQARNQENRHANCDEHSKNASVRHQPMCQVLHSLLPLPGGRSGPDLVIEVYSNPVILTSSEIQRFGCKSALW
jgi:hypothetical protein